MPERDKDAGLKLRAARYLWHLGYVCPMQVSLSGLEIRRGELRRYDLTDLDVVGIKFESDLTARVVIADCKSGRTSSVSRMFWLRGVMDFFGAARGYLIQPNIGRECRELALKLSISLLDNENLSRVEDEQSLSRIGLTSFTTEAYDRRRELLSLRFPKGYQPNEDERALGRVYQYLAFGYWFNDEYRNVQQLVRTFADAAGVLTRLDRRKAKALAYTGLVLWSVSVLRMCGAVIATKSGDIHAEVRRYIFGGVANAADRQKLMKYFAKLSETEVNLEPPYYDQLLELAARLARYSPYSKDVPRYAAVVLNENAISGREEPLQGLLGSGYQVDTLKLTKDVAQVFTAAAGLDATLLEDLMRQ